MDRLREKKERLQQLKRQANVSPDKSEQPQLSTFDMLATAMTGNDSPNSTSKRPKDNVSIAEAGTTSSTTLMTAVTGFASDASQHMPSPESLNGESIAVKQLEVRNHTQGDQKQKASTTGEGNADQPKLSSTGENGSIEPPEVPSRPDYKSKGGEGRRESMDEEEVDEFGRVKRRRQHYSSADGRKGQRDDSDNDSQYDSDYDRHPRRRRRSHSEDGRRQNSRTRGRYSSRSRSPRSRSRSRSHSTKQRDPYTAAARYIDTEFFPSKIYVGDLVGVNKDQLEDAFSAFGHIVDIKTVDGKDFAFITYDDTESALYAIKRMDGVKLGRYRVKVNRAKIPERNRVGFGNVPWKDEDGVVAQEENHRHSHSNTVAPQQEMDPRAFGRGRKVLSYDDL
ncbi:unnamed protein product [Umbelopsis ramanniana]